MMLNVSISALKWAFDTLSCQMECFQMQHSLNMLSDGTPTNTGQPRRTEINLRHDKIDIYLPLEMDSINFFYEAYLKG